MRRSCSLPFAARILVAAVCCAAGLSLAAGPLLAQLPVTELTTIYPPSARQGTTVQVTVGGDHQDDLTGMLFSHPGIQARQLMREPGEFQLPPRPLNNQFEVSVAADVPPGVYEARVVGRFGASNPRAFLVGSLEEQGEAGNNKSADAAQPLEVGSAVYGRVDGSSRDYYRLNVKAGQRVIIEAYADRIDSRMDATLQVLDAEQRVLAQDRDTVGADPLIEFTAPQDGDFLVAVYDFLYDGGGEYFYRLGVHEAPRIDFVFPPAGQPGSNDEYTIYGRNLPGGKPAEGVTLEGEPLQQVRQRIQLPEASQEPPFGSLLFPRVAVVDGIRYQLERSNPVQIGLARAPIVTEQEPNNREAEAQVVTLPCEYVGQFYPGTDDDWFQFEARQGDVYWIEVLSHRLGLPTDPLIRVLQVNRNDEGEESTKELALVDDPADRNSQIGSDFDVSTDDPSYRLQVPADGTYRVMVRDNFGSGRKDPRMVYRVVVEAERPDFRLVAVPQQIKVANNNQVLQFAPVLRPGGTTLLRVVARRMDGFSGDIEISAEGLPAGVHCEGALLGEHQDEAWLIFRAASDAADWSGAIKVLGRAEINGETVSREARSGSVAWGTNNRSQAAPEFRVTRDLVLSVAAKEQAPALVQVGDGEMLETAKGGVLEVPIQLSRHADFKETVKLTAVGLPNELKPGDVTINADKNEGTLKLEIKNGNAKPGSYTFFLRSDTKIKRPYNPEAIPQAEDEVKVWDEVVKRTDEEMKQAAAAKSEADKKAQEATAARQKAEQEKNAAAQQLQSAEQAEKQAQEALAKAQEAAEKDAENQGLKEQLKAAQEALEQATAARQTAAETLTQQEQALAEATAAVATAEEARKQAEQQLQQLQEKLKRAQTGKQAADKALADAKKNNAPKDFNLALVSTPIKLKLVDSPLQLGDVAALTLKQDASGELEVPVTRMYGCEDQVEVLLELPKGTAGISAQKVDVPKDQMAGKLEVKVAKDAKPGSYEAVIKARVKFNNVTSEVSRPVTITVEETPQS